ncbi:MAG: hypothetical protein JJD98_00225 [Polaromonas sp.]|nr:hypothetical protein [Polaromonas sp.]
MKTPRLHDWQICYERFVSERQNMPFAWGSNDCCTFAADCVLALTGADVALPELRTHTTELQAARLLKKHGGVAGIATTALGEPIAALLANVGDVVLTDMGGGDTLAICNGSSCMAPGPHGLVHLGMDTARACWRVA